MAMRFTKSLAAILGFLCLITFAFAQEGAINNSVVSWEFSAIQEYNFEFKAVADGGKINLSWRAFPEGEDFKWYKLAYSATKENPSYPEDASHFIGEKREQTSGEFWSKEKMLYVRLCAVTHSNERFCSGSRKVTLNQETSKTPVKIETPTMCTMEYAPVCGELNVPVMNGSSIPTKTFSNKCMLSAEKAKFLYEGECKKTSEEPEKACTKEYAPVCGKTPAKTCMGPGCSSVQKTYGNKCMLEAEKATFLSEGECEKNNENTEVPKNTDTKIYKGNVKTCQLIKFACDEGTQYFSDSKGCGCEKAGTTKVPDALKAKMKKVIDTFIVKLEAKWYSDEKNLATIEQTIEKLQKLGQKQQYKNLSVYAIELLNQYKSKYQDDFSEFEKIFSDF